MALRKAFRRLHFLSIVAGIFLYIFCSTLSPIAMAVESTEKLTNAELLKKTDLLSTGEKMYSTSKDWESGTNLQYNKEAFYNFSEKLSLYLERDPGPLGETLRKKCQGCRPIFMPTLNDDPDFIKYIQSHSDTESGEKDIAFILTNHLNPAFGALDAKTISDLRDLMIKEGAKIRQQVQSLTDANRDIGLNGAYTDGNVDNSPYDLLDDKRRIDEIFFREAPEFGKYKNTNSADAPGLITGKVTGGSWGGGENYTIDLASDIEEALGGDDGDSSTQDDGVLAGDCESGYCITIDFIKNTHYFLGQGGASDKGKNSFQGLFEDGLDWIIKNGDNRNFACKVTPTINTWESEFDAGAILKNLFSGVSIQVFFRTPPFARGQIERNGTSTKEEKLKKQDKETLNDLKDSFAARGMKFDQPTDIKASDKQLFEKFALDTTLAYNRADAALNAYNQMIHDDEQYRAAAGSETEGAVAHETNTGSIEMMEKIFDGLGSSTKKLHDLMKDLNLVINALNEKEECKTA